MNCTICKQDVNQAAKDECGYCRCARRGCLEPLAFPHIVDEDDERYCSQACLERQRDDDAEAAYERMQEDYYGGSSPTPRERGEALRVVRFQQDRRDTR